MSISPWHDDTALYNLSPDFSLEKADSKKFILYLAIYLPEMNNLQEWSLNITQYDNNDKFLKNCFWIKQNKKTIGGVVIYPNRLDRFFLIPPFDSKYTVLKLIKKALILWSDSKDAVRTYTALPEDQEIYYRIGFQVIEKRRVMLRPTQRFSFLPDNWLENTFITNPTFADSTEIAQFLLESYHNSIDEAIFTAFEKRQPNLEDQTTAVNNFFASNTSEKEFDPLLSASYLVREKNEKNIIAVCLIALWKRWPLVYDIAVDHKYREKGLGQFLLKKSLTVLSDMYDILRLFVTLGNKSEAMYYELGFMPGNEIMVMIIPPSEN